MIYNFGFYLFLKFTADKMKYEWNINMNIWLYGILHMQWICHDWKSITQTAEYCYLAFKDQNNNKSGPLSLPYCFTFILFYIMYLTRRCEEIPVEIYTPLSDMILTFHNRSPKVTPFDNWLPTCKHSDCVFTRWGIDFKWNSLQIISFLYNWLQIIIVWEHTEDHTSNHGLSLM